MDLDNVPSQSDRQGIESAKKAIEAVRRDMAFKKATTTSKMCTKTDHLCGCTERDVKSKELTQKAIEKICCNFSTKKSTPTSNIGEKNHRSLYSNVFEEEKKAGASTGATAEADGQSEANSTTLKGVSIITATCECCGEGGIEVNHLVRIDSGQLLCPDCLASFRKSASYKSG